MSKRLVHFLPFFCFHRKGGRWGPRGGGGGPGGGGVRGCSSLSWVFGLGWFGSGPVELSLRIFLQNCRIAKLRVLRIEGKLARKTSGSASGSLLFSVCGKPDQSEAGIDFPDNYNAPQVPSTPPERPPQALTVHPGPLYKRARPTLEARVHRPIRDEILVQISRSGNREPACPWVPRYFPRAVIETSVRAAIIR